MDLKVNENCIGCGACIAVCPEVFDFEDDQAKVVGKITDENKEDAVNAMESCPVGAIIEDKEEN